MTRRAIDLSVYLVTDPVLARRHGLIETVRAAVAGGATAVQLRDKHAGDAAMVEQARAIQTIVRPLGVPLVINDRVEVAIAVGADALHIGQDDLAPRLARERIGPTMALGLSAGDEQEILTVDPAIVDHVGMGPFAATSTKPDASAPLGATRFAALRARVPLPVVAIGGIGAANAADAIRAGADGIAVVSAICGADDPEAATRRLADIVRRARAR
ncbi:MAG: thiamine phosphate synthase [Alphaproteobacteria bacterium]|nr:thiamine phosphate synthase [Alphaproteobacteria bacterium]